MNPLPLTLMRRAAVALTVALPLAAAAQTTKLPTSTADESFPIVQLMPVVMKYEADFALTPQQAQALAEFRRTGMPKRVAIEQEIKQVRAELRQAILAGAPEAQREALLERWLQAEREHARARMRCAAFLRETLSAEQMAKIQQYYLFELR